MTLVLVALKNNNNGICFDLECVTVHIYLA